MGTQTVTKARKDHTCSLCHETIPKGVEYIRREVRPWDTQGNSGFFTYKVHPACDVIWQAAGEGFDWLLPTAKNEWPDVVEAYNFEMARRERAVG